MSDNAQILSSGSISMSDNQPNRKTTQHISPINLRTVNNPNVETQHCCVSHSSIRSLFPRTRQVPRHEFTLADAPSFRRFCERYDYTMSRSTTERQRLQPKIRRIIPDRNALANTQNSVTTHIPMSPVRSTDAVSTEREIPVPSATYAAKHAGHLGSNARISVGSEHFAQANRGRATDGGWALPSAALCEPLRAAFAAIEQQDRFFIGDPHSRSRMKLPSAPPQPSLRDSDHGGGPKTS